MMAFPQQAKSLQTILSSAGCKYTSNWLPAATHKLFFLQFFMNLHHKKHPYTSTIRLSCYANVCTVPLYVCCNVNV